MAAPVEEPIRLAELMAALSLATDLGLGRPLEAELGVCLVALELTERLGCEPQERADVYYLALLVHVGCTSAASHFATWVGGDDIHFQSRVQALGPASEAAENLRYMLREFADDATLTRRVRLVGRQMVAGRREFAAASAALCEGGSLLARRLRLSDEVARALGQVTARWDGNGPPAGAAGEAISRPLRIVRVAHDVVAVARARGGEASIAALTRRRGRGYDPQVVDAALEAPESLLQAAEVPDPWERVLDSEPQPRATVSAAGLQDVARAFAEFVDVKVPFLSGHSTRVADLGARAAAALGCSPAEVSTVRAAGFFHDLGRVAVPNGVWEKPGPLGEGERERVRLHPYYTERVLERSAQLAPLAVLAGSHHERLDGSGYHRGSAAGQLALGARLLAAADVFDAMMHDRPHRPALDPARARSELGALVKAGALDRRAVDAVLEVAGAAPLELRQGHPAGLTDREVEVLRLIARGRTNRQIAEALVVTEKTAGHHVEHIYAKTGVSTRVGAALFAMRHDLVE